MPWAVIDAIRVGMLAAVGAKPWATAAVVVTAAAAAFALRKRSGTPQGDPERPRRLRASSSGTTRFMVSGMHTYDDYDGIINVCATVSPMPDMAAFQQQWREHLLPHERFHSVPFQRQPLAEVMWLPQRVDMDHHFFQRSVPDVETARAVIDTLSNALLKDKSRPWWEVHFVHVDGQSEGFVVLRINHALGDGISLVEAFAPMLQDRDGNPHDLSGLFNPRRGSGVESRSGVVANTLLSPLRALRYAVSFAVESLRAIGVGMRPGDTFNRFYRPPFPYTGNRITVYFPAHSLALVKAIKDKVGGGVTVNDVEFAVFGGMVRRFLMRHDPSAPLALGSMRALTPLALPEACDPKTKYKTLLRNTFTFVVNTVPVSQTTALERLCAAHKSWCRLKQSAAVPASFFIQRISSRLPLEAQRQGLKDLASRVSVVFSNVPGPQAESYVCGSRVTAIHMIYPNFIPQVGIVSLDGQVHMCLSIAADDNGVDLRAVLPQCHAEELSELAVAVGVAGV